MLSELHIRDFGIADDLRLVFAAGLTCITGATGAGKSLIVNALAFVLGERGQSEWVRTGADGCEVSAVFGVPKHRAFGLLRRELGLERGDALVLRRDLSLSGRSRVWLNDRPATVGALRQLGQMLCDLHGQHQHQWLLNPDMHAEFLDAFVDREVRTTYEASFAQHQRCQGAHSAFREELGAALKQRDFWTFQLQELERLNPKPGEYEELKQRRERIRHAAALGELYRLLEAEVSGSDDSIVARFGDLEHRLENASGLDPVLADWAGKLALARHLIEEIGGAVSRRMLDDDGSPEALEVLETRLFALYRLQQKFNGSLEDAIHEREVLARRLRDLADADRRSDELSAALRAAEAELETAARVLHEARARAVRRLTGALRGPLSELGLGEDPVSVAHQMLPSESWVQSGPDRVELLLAANPREEPKPLAKIASGGELSRVMLALKSVLPGGDRVGTLVFDEIDSGIGGETAARVALRLAALARGRQVIVITHLHPIAAGAEHHWEVAKKTVQGRHVPTVRSLSDRERVEALGRLIGGGQATRESRAAARTLVRSRRRD